MRLSQQQIRRLMSMSKDACARGIEDGLQKNYIRKVINGEFGGLGPKGAIYAIKWADADPAVVTKTGQSGY